MITGIEIFVSTQTERHSVLSAIGQMEADLVAKSLIGDRLCISVHLIDVELNATGPHVHINCRKWTPDSTVRAASSLIEDGWPEELVKPLAWLRCD